MVTRQPQESVLWPRDADCNSWVRVYVWEREGGSIRRRRCWDFHSPLSSTFITNLSGAKWMLRCSKLTLRVTQAVSAVCGITFHPNVMDGGLTTVTLTLLHYTTLLRLTRLSLGWVGWDHRHSQSPRSLQKHNHLPIIKIYLWWDSSTNMLGSRNMSSSGFIFKDCLCVLLGLSSMSPWITAEDETLVRQKLLTGSLAN